MSNIVPIPSPTLETILQIMGMLVTAAGSAVVLYRKYLKQPLEALRALSTVPEQVEKIHYEVGRNGGSSLADKIESISTQLTRLEARQKHYTFVKGEDNRGLFETDSKGNWTIINPAISRLLGRPESEILQQSWINGVKYSERSKIWAEYNDSVLNGRHYEAIIPFISLYNSEIIKVHLKLAPMKANSQIFAWSGEFFLEEET